MCREREQAVVGMTLHGHEYQWSSVKAFGQQPYDVRQGSLYGAERKRRCLNLALPGVLHARYQNRMSVWSTLSWWRVSPWHMLTPPPWQNDVCLHGVTANPSLLKKTYDFFSNWSDDSKWPCLACALIHKWSHRRHWCCWGACFSSTWPEGGFYGLSSHHTFYLNVTNPLDTWHVPNPLLTLWMVEFLLAMSSVVRFLYFYAATAKLSIVKCPSTAETLIHSIENQHSGRGSVTKLHGIQRKSVLYGFICWGVWVQKTLVEYFVL